MIVPDDFAPFAYPSPFLTLVGPLYSRSNDSGLTIGLRVEERHCNRRGTAHGGILTTLADIVLGYTAGHALEETRQLTTAALTVEFLGAAQIGDWIEADATILKVGRRLAYADCLLTVAGAPVVHATGVFSVR